MAVSGFREYPHALDRADGVFRILCIGDSMVFGQGVKFDETVPYQLEVLLNKANWSNCFEVINAGVCGHSFYHGWQRILKLSKSYQPDLVVFVVCENDAELFSCTEYGLVYDEHISRLWDQNEDDYKYLVRAIDGLDSDLQALGLPCILAYYHTFGPLKSNDPAKILKDLSHDRTFHYVDLSEEFYESQCAFNNKNMKVSASDNHPSALAHGIAARRLAREILQANYFVSDDEASEISLKNQVLNAADEMFKNGRSASFALLWAIETLSAKHSSLWRDKLSAEHILDDDQFAALLSDLKATAGIHTILLCLEGYANYLKYQLEQGLWANLSKINEALLEWHKKCFVVENNLKNSLLQYDPFEGFEHINDTNPTNALLTKSVMSSKDGIHRIAILEKELSTFTLHQTELLALTNDFESRLRSLQKFIISVWQDVLDQQSDLISKQERLEQLSASLARAEDCQNRNKWLNALTIKLDDIEVLQNEMLKAVNTPVALFSTEAGYPSKELSHVEIVLSNNKPTGGSLGLYVYSQVPSIYVIEYYNLLESETKQIVNFSIPYFARARLTITLVAGAEQNEIKSVMVYRSSERKTDVKLQGSNGHYRSEMLVFPN